MFWGVFFSYISCVCVCARARVVLPGGSFCTKMHTCLYIFPDLFIYALDKVLDSGAYYRRNIYVIWRRSSFSASIGPRAPMNPLFRLSASIKPQIKLTRSKIHKLSQHSVVGNLWNVNYTAVEMTFIEEFYGSFCKVKDAKFRNVSLIRNFAVLSILFMETWDSSRFKW